MAVSLACFPIPMTVYQSFQLILALQNCQPSVLNYEGYKTTQWILFATAIEYENDEIEANVEDSGDNIVGEDDFKPVMDVCYKTGDGHNKTARNINAVEVNGAELRKIQLLYGTLANVFACHLQLLEQPYLTNIPVDVETYFKEVESGLTTEDISDLSHPQDLSPLQQDFLYLESRLYHMPNHRLIQLSKERVIPHCVSALKDKPPIYASCCFGRAHKRPCLTKCKHTNTIQYKDDVNPGDCVSTDQIVSAQPGLVPQTSGNLTSNQIWGITLFVNHATDYTYGHLPRSIDLDETLGAKKVFEKLVGRSNNTVKR